jgi:long-chain acyl-CoA synthetase
MFGPRIDWLSSGGAPLPIAVAAAYQAAGLLLLQGYGLTETSPVISFNRKDKYKLETVGPPLDGVEVRIATDSEILTRGPHVMAGYWNNPAATAEMIRDGWLHTGDLGVIDADGFLKITGRKKELLVLSSGKKVAPSQIECLLLADPCIDQVVVCGEGRSYLTALVVPHWDNIRKELGKAEVTALSTTDLARRDEVCGLLRQRIDRALATVSNCEQVRRFHVLAEPFSVANEELTVSLKLRRAAIGKRHERVIDHMYSDGK